MNKDELKKYLKENLKVEVSIHEPNTLIVRLHLEDDMISCDSWPLR